MASAINDWLREEFLERDDRLRASLVVSDGRLPTTRSRRSSGVGDDRRFVQVLLPVRSDVPWGNKNNHAMFAAARERGLQIALHAWGRAGNAPTPSGFTTTYLEDYVGNQPIAQAQMLSFVSEGVFERFPDLGVVLTRVRLRLAAAAAVALRQGLEGRVARGAVGQGPAVGVRHAPLPLHDRARAPAARPRRARPAVSR